MKCSISIFYPKAVENLAFAFLEEARSSSAFNNAQCYVKRSGGAECFLEDKFCSSLLPAKISECSKKLLELRNFSSKSCTLVIAGYFSEAYASTMFDAATLGMLFEIGIPVSLVFYPCEVERVSPANIERVSPG